MGHYDAAQICLNGHVINSTVHKYPSHNSAFCSRCGSPTITDCPSCKTPIRGRYVIDMPVPESVYGRPAFCRQCGKPYPWTEARVQAAKDLFDELDELSPIEREKLKDSLDDLVRDGPKTEVAGIKFKKIAQKLGEGSLEMLKKTLTDLLSQTAKKMLFGP